MVRLIAVLLLAAVAAAGYGVYAASRVYQDLGNGRDHLLAGQAALDAAIKGGDPGTVRLAAAELAAAEADFRRGSARLQGDLALQFGARAPGTKDQVEAVAHLAAIGEDMVQAGSAAEQIAEGVIALKRVYAGRAMSVADVAALAHDADALAQRYAAAASAIGRDLKAAHQERAHVTTTALAPQLRAAYDQVDEALAKADVAFLQFQDPRRILSQLFGITLPA
jgi:hypothetical protein